MWQLTSCPGIFSSSPLDVLVPLVSSVLSYPSQYCLRVSSMVFPQVFIHNSTSILCYLFQGFLWIFPTVPPPFLLCRGVSPTPNPLFFLVLEPAGNQQLRLLWNYVVLTVNTLTLTAMRIEISVLNEPAATRTWLSLSESTEEFFVWTVCWVDSSLLTTKTWQTILYILEFPATQATSDFDVRNFFFIKTNM